LFKLTAVCAERGLRVNSIPAVCILDFEGDPSDALVAEGSASISGAWACFHTTMFSIDVVNVPFGLIPHTSGGA